MPEQQMNILSFYSSTAVSIIVGILHFAISNMTKKFVDVFEGFGAELPGLTQFLVDGSLYFWIMPSLVVVGLIAHHFGHLSRRSILYMSSLGTIASIVLCVVGLYLPIFLLGGVVSS